MRLLWAAQKTIQFETIVMMRILSLLSTFPPHVFGGGEISAINLNKWLSLQGHTMGVLTSADIDDEEERGKLVDGVRIWRVRFPRFYTFWQHEHQSKPKKLIWHLQDHFDPRNKRLVATVLDEFKPEFALVHVVSGMGYNALYALAERNIPAIYFMHDLNVVCAKGGMFKEGEDCIRQCSLCRIVSHVRLSAITSIPRLSFCSPSRANLEKAAEFAPLERYKCVSILNANKYPLPTVERQVSDHVRFLYVGRFQATKGITVLMEALEGLADKYQFTLTLLGTGPEEEAIRRRFGSRSWCRLVGRVPQGEVSNHMASSDVLCIPSLWLENSPGVVIHALSQGLPVVGSDKGGIPELVRNGETGLLVPPGDTAAWSRALASILDSPARLDVWRTNALNDSRRFDQDYIGAKLLELIEDTARQS
jgi:glycosyltransferase involved in cell wall biosynthesis